MNTYRKMLIATLAVAAAALGCSSGGSSTTDTTTNAAPTTPPVTATTPPAGDTSTLKPTNSSAPADGAALFAQNCSGCHGDKGAGGKKAPALAGRHIDADKAAGIIAKGKGRMPSFKSRLSDDQIKAIGKYVSTL